MTSITVKLQGIKMVRAGLQNLRAQIPLVSRSRIRDAMENIVARMQKYPAPLPGQKYVRTYNLQRSWVISPVASGYRISNDAVSPRGKHYTTLVVGDARGEGQAKIHQGRWNKTKDVVQAILGKLPMTIVEGLRVSGKKL